MRLKENTNPQVTIHRLRRLLEGLQSTDYTDFCPRITRMAAHVSPPAPLKGILGYAIIRRGDARRASLQSRPHRSSSHAIIVETHGVRLHGVRLCKGKIINGEMSKIRNIAEKNGSITF